MGEMRTEPPARKDAKTAEAAWQNYFDALRPYFGPGVVNSEIGKQWSARVKGMISDV